MQTFMKRDTSSDNEPQSTQQLLQAQATTETRKYRSRSSDLGIVYHRFIVNTCVIINPYYTVIMIPSQMVPRVLQYAYSIIFISFVI